MKYNIRGLLNSIEKILVFENGNRAGKETAQNNFGCEICVQWVKYIILKYFILSNNLFQF